jgi:hypothetical protein
MLCYIMTNIVGLTFLTYFTISIIYDTVDIWDPYNQLAYNDLHNDEHYYNFENLDTDNATTNSTVQDIVHLNNDILDNRFLRRKI